MRPSRPDFSRVAGLSLVALLWAQAGWAQASADTALRHRVVHLLNRVTFGPRPGDVDRVLTLGIERYLDEQLNPDRIPDIAAQEYVRGLDVFGRSAADLARAYVQEQEERRERQRRVAQDSGMMAAGRPEPSTIRRYGAELQQAAIARAILSERQLYEVLVDFWTNHFNVFMAKGMIGVVLPAYLEETIRPRALGRFEDLLLATAQSPAMLLYLDNAQSVAPGSEPPSLRQAGRPAGRQRFPGRISPQQERRQDSLRAAAAARMPRGLNENYARELLELHTLGVDGGYSQEDVVNVARILTGWSVRRGAGAPEFVFNEWAHDRGTKAVLGREFRSNGVREGRDLIAFLARHPSTMRHVSAKLCARFVSDVPSDGCVDAGVHAWRRTDGEIRQVVRAVLVSDEFWAPEHRSAKLKTPLEFVASAARALGAEPDHTPALAVLVARLGQPLFLQSAPTGYPEREESWVNSGALLQRFNAALALAGGRLPGLNYVPEAVVLADPDPERLIAQVDRVILSGLASDATRNTMRRQLLDLDDSVTARAFALGLALGSPEFQRQ